VYIRMSKVIGSWVWAVVVSPKTSERCVELRGPAEGLLLRSDMDTGITSLILTGWILVLVEDGPCIFFVR
jgi:hypothetical protein